MYWWGLVGHQVFELVSEFFHAQMGYSRQLFNFRRILKIISAKAKHIPARYLVMLGFNINGAKACLPRNRVDHILKRNRVKLSILHADDGVRAAVEQIL